MGAKNSGVPSSMRFPIFILPAKLKIEVIYLFVRVFYSETLKNCFSIKNGTAQKTMPLFNHFSKERISAFFPSNSIFAYAHPFAEMEC
jgi:hypothetical protein